AAAQAHLEIARLPTGCDAPDAGGVHAGDPRGLGRHPGWQSQLWDRLRLDRVVGAAHCGACPILRAAVVHYLSHPGAGRMASAPRDRAAQAGQAVDAWPALAPALEEHLAAE